MGRKKRAENDTFLDRKIGERVARARLERGWTQAELGDRLLLSGAQVSALEAGQHGFSAALLFRTSQELGRSLSYLVTDDIANDESLHPWQQLYSALQERDRAIVIDLARKLAYWPEAKPQRRPRRTGPWFLALEGIDGCLLDRVGKALATRRVAGLPTVFAPHNYKSSLWQYILSRLRGRGMEQQGTFERTLLFACERLQRQESELRFHLAREHSVVAPFFAMAAAVYQEVEGSPDRRIIDIVETLVLKPDLIVLISSDPEIAASRAVCDVPGKDQFFSQYSSVKEFAHARWLYEHACDEFVDRGYEVLNIAYPAVAKSVDDIVDKIVDRCQLLQTT